MTSRLRYTAHDLLSELVACCCTLVAWVVVLVAVAGWLAWREVQELRMIWRWGREKRL